MDALEKYFARGFLGDSKEPEAPPSETQIIAQIMDLKEYAARYAAGNPFKVGDLVTPRISAPMVGAGLPYIVIEVADAPYRTFHADNPATNFFGRRLDVRVASFVQKSLIVSHWVESVNLEPYTGPMPEEH